MKNAKNNQSAQITRFLFYIMKQRVKFFEFRLIISMGGGVLK